MPSRVIYSRSPLPKQVIYCSVRCRSALSTAQSAAVASALTEPWTLEEPPRALSTHLPNPAVPVLPGAPARAASLPALPVERMRAPALQ